MTLKAPIPNSGDRVAYIIEGDEDSRMRGSEDGPERIRDPDLEQ